MNVLAVSEHIFPKNKTLLVEYMVYMSQCILLKEAFSGAH